MQRHTRYKQVVLQIWKILQVKELTSDLLCFQFLCPQHLCLLFSSLCSVWTEEAQCTLLNASITETFNCSFSCGPDCWKLSQYPCLQVYVNLTSSGEKLLLYHTEETIKINQKVGAWHTLHLIHPHVAPHQFISLCSSSVPAFQSKHATTKPTLPHPVTEFIALLDPCLRNIYFLCKSWSNQSPLCSSEGLAFTSIQKGKHHILIDTQID